MDLVNLPTSDDYGDAVSATGSYTSSGRYCCIRGVVGLVAVELVVAVVMLTVDLFT